MHVTKTELTLSTARAVELQRHNERRTEVLKQQPGFLGSTLLNSLGYPVMQMSPMYFRTTKYVLLMDWDSAEAAQDCFESVDWHAFADAHRSEQLFSPQEPVQHYEVVQEHGQVLDRAPFAWLMQFSGDGSSEGSATLEAEVAQLFDLYRDHLPGFRQGRVLASHDQPGHVLGMLLLNGQTEFPPGQAVPELAAFQREHFPVVDADGRLVPEGFQVVHLLKNERLPAS